jgi:hypothetical protein
MRRDTPIFGFFIGILLPFVGLIIMYFLWGHHQGFGSFLKSMTHLKGMASKVLTLSILINLIPFAYCNIKRIDQTMRGIFIATMLYVLLIVLIMFVW